jgi:hypothetical protein
MSSEMKAVFEALLPQGAIWRPREGGDFDRLLDGIGENAQYVYEYIAALAVLRDPSATTMLADLEREYGILASTAVSEAVRRTALAAEKYARPTTNSWAHLQDRLRAAGFDDIYVTPNDPAADPAGYMGELLVNGPICSAQTPAYLMQCGGDFAYCGNAKAVCGYFINIGRTLHEYTIPDAWQYWRFFFFVSAGPVGTWPAAPPLPTYQYAPGRLEELKRLILRHKPERSWCILVAEEMPT